MRGGHRVGGLMQGSGHRQEAVGAGSTPADRLPAQPEAPLGHKGGDRLPGTAGEQQACWVGYWVLMVCLVLPQVLPVASAGVGVGGLLILPGLPVTPCTGTPRGHRPLPRALLCAGDPCGTGLRCHRGNVTKRGAELGSGKIDQHTGETEARPFFLLLLC